MRAEAAERADRLCEQRQPTVLTGQGVAVNASEAEHWWRMAADQGYSSAQYNLGGMYSRKLSTTMLRIEAVEWLGLAAEQGHRSAAKELSELQTTIAAEADVAELDSVPAAPNSATL
jgi:TPR repeat protein